MLALLLTTRTDWGREKIRAFAEARLAGAIQGKVHIGRISGSLFTDLVVDSFALREKNDSLFISTGPVSVRFDLRDLLDRRILVREVTIEHPVVHLTRDSTDNWNFRKLFPSRPSSGQRSPTRNFGDYIVVNNAQLRDTRFVLSLPWEPDDSLRGAKRDSAITYALSREDKDIRRAGSGYQQVRTWSDGDLRVPYAVISHFDSAGRFFELADLNLVESDPPLQVSNARGTVRLLGDSLWAEIAHFELPGSRGSASGKVWWGSDLPTRYDLTVRGDSVSLADVNWVYPTLPTTGGGSLGLRIVNDERDLDVLDYVLDDMDVRTTKSRLRGSMTFGIGGAIMSVKNVDVRGTPMDWELIERLTGEPLPYPFKGPIAMTVRAPGGPVNRFRVTEAQFTFDDANVPGKRAVGRARGELDFLEPAFTKFRGFDVEIDRFDLETMQFLNPTFPKLNGWISGRATLDSVWTDVRLRNADITHHYDQLTPSRFTGGGRVTIGEQALVYDLALEALPLSLATIAQAWPEMELEQRGDFFGPVRIQGATNDLAIVAEVRGAPGTIAFDGRVDLDSIGGTGYAGTLRFTNLDLRTLYDTTSMPVTALTGSAELNITGDSLPLYEGTIAIALQRSMIDSTRLYDDTRARLRFHDGVLSIDTMMVSSTIGSLIARGGLGLRSDRRDTLELFFRGDSLGALRPYLRRAAQDSIARESVEQDSLAAYIEASPVRLVGSIDSLSVRGVIDFRDINAWSATAERARVSLELDEVGTSRVRGTASITGDTVMAGGIAIKDAAVDLNFANRDSIDALALVTLNNGPVLNTQAAVKLSPDTSRVSLSRFRIAFDDHEWSTQQPASIKWWGEGERSSFAMDSVRLAGNQGGIIDFRGAIPADSTVDIQLNAERVALRDLAAIGQTRVQLAGTVSFGINITGQRTNPLLSLDGELNGTRVGEVTLERTTFTGRYENQRFLGNLAVLRNDTTVLGLVANVPLDLALESRSRRLLDDTMRVSLESRDVDLALVESFTPALTEARGRLNASVSLAGRPSSRSYEGFLRIDSAGALVPDLGIRVRNVFADITARDDSITIRRLSMVSGEESRDSMWVTGGLSLEVEDDPSFDLTLGAREFHVINKQRIGDLDISAGLRLQGKQSASELSGNVTVNDGYVVIPPLSSKDVVSLDDPDLYMVVDTTLAANRSLLPKAPPAIVRGLTVRNVQISMGPDVRLRSEEANIKLGGSVNVIVGRGLGVAGTPQLALEGALTTERGTFLMRFGDGFLSRLFTIEGGQVRFLGDADFNPDLAISAIYTVRTTSLRFANRSDVRIRARLLGTLAQPRIVLENADDVRLSDSDLISYLITGRPSAEIGGLSSASNFALSTLSSNLSARFSGRFFDYLQLQTMSGALSAGTQTTNGSNPLYNILQGTQLGIGKQLNERTFVTVTAGLCQLGGQLGFGQSGFSDAFSISDAFGVTVEYEIAENLGISVSHEPSQHAAFACVPTLMGFAPTKPQLSIDLFRVWRW